MSASRGLAVVLPLLLFFASGAAALIYETVWVREFGRFLGNTSMSVALVSGLFVGGLGMGSFLAGRTSFLTQSGVPREFWRAYAVCEWMIGLAGLITLAAEQFLLTALPAYTASYELNQSGLWVLTKGSVLAQLGVSAILILPTTMLMGATLPLLLRVTRDISGSNGWRFGLVYGANTAGAMMGCLLVDLLLIPFLGSWGTQLAAISVNFLVGMAAWFLPRTSSDKMPAADLHDPVTQTFRLDRQQFLKVAFAFAIVAVAGFVAMGLQVIWARFLTTALGGTRGVFSLLLAVILGGLWLGSLAGGWSVRRWRSPWAFCALGLVMLIASSMCGLIWFDRALLATGSFAGLHQILNEYHLSWVADVL